MRIDVGESMKNDACLFNPYVKIFYELPEDSKEIRTEVFVKEQGFNEEFDTVDHRAIHLVAYLDKKPIGTCRIFTEEEQAVFFLGRLAVLPEFRGKSVGGLLIKESEACALERGGRVIKLHSQVRAKGFYEKCGYTEYGEIEYEENCPHIWMKKDIRF